MAPRSFGVLTYNDVTGARETVGDTIGGMQLAQRLTVNDDTAALLWDMDGVLLDTLSMDYELVNRVLASCEPDYPPIARTVIRANFGYPVPEFWRRITVASGIMLPQTTLAHLVDAYEIARWSTPAQIHSGILEILSSARDNDIPLAVVSSNPESAIVTMLTLSGLVEYFTAVVGMDNPPISPKPAPDIYLMVARRLGVSATECVAIEDSLVGAAAASAAGCYTIGVATGANTFAELCRSSYVNRCYPHFAQEESLPVV